MNYERLKTAPLTKKMEATLVSLFLLNRYNQGPVLHRLIDISRRGMVALGRLPDGTHLQLVTEKGLKYIKENNLLRQFDNEERHRYYGKRVGDRVSQEMHTYPPQPGAKKLGTVIEFGFMDNNKVIVQFDGEEKPTACVAEYLSVEEKVEDRPTCSICGSTYHDQDFHLKADGFKLSQ